MPAELECVDKEQVKIVAMAVGVREAARQFGLNEYTVLSWSKREDWFPDNAEQIQEEARVKLREKQGLPSVALKGSEIMKEYSGETRLGHAKAAHKLGKKFAEMDPNELLMVVPALAQAGSHADKVFGWTQTTVNVGLRLDQIAGITSVAASFESPPDP